MRSLYPCLALAAVLFTSACYSPDYGDGDLACGPGGACPEGYYCHPDNHRCYLDLNGHGDAGGADAPVVADGAPDAEPPDAAPPDAPACTRQWISILNNGNFESGGASWTQSRSMITNATFMNAQSGSYWAFMAGIATADDTLEQTVNVPATSDGTRFHGWRCFVKQSGANGQVTVTLGSETIATFNEPPDTSACNWAEIPWTSGAGHAGQSIKLKLHATTTTSALVSFHFDTLALEAHACP